MNNTGLHGKFKKIDKEFMKDAFKAFEMIEQVQKKYGKTDNDTVINEARDAKVSSVLGYGYINTDKHGWDAMNDSGKFLEVKQASSSSHSIGATFNDTSIEKTDEIGTGNVEVALAVWSSMRELLFIVHGINPEIGPHMKAKIIAAHEKGNIRPGTVTISMKDLIRKFGFKVRPVGFTREQTSEFLFNKMKKLNKEISEIPFDNEA